MDTHDTPAENMTRSLVPLDGNSHQLSVQGAACLSSILTGKQSSENCEQALALLTILLGITENTLSRDVIDLSLASAEKRAEELGIDPEVFKKVARRYWDLHEQMRSRNPMACLF